MLLNQLQNTIAQALVNMKAKDILLFNTSGLTSEFERVFIVSGTSNRHTRSIAFEVAHAVNEKKGEVTSIEGLDTGEWVLVDCGPVIVHIMQPTAREYYALEEIWGNKQIQLKILKEDRK